MAVFILNFKVFHFGYKKTRYVKTSAEHSIAWAKSEYMDATSYLNSTLDCTTEGDSFVSDTAMKREMRSYGIISIKVEKIEYIGSSTDASFILYDASQGPTDKSSDLPAIENSELGKDAQKSGFKGKEVLSDKTNLRGKNASKHVSRHSKGTKSKNASNNGLPEVGKSRFNSTQPALTGRNPTGNTTFSSNTTSNVSVPNNRAYGDKNENLLLLS